MAELITVEQLNNDSEGEPVDPLIELNADLEKLLASWKKEYKTTTNPGAGPMQKRYVARGPVNAFLNKHLSSESRYRLVLLVGLTDDNFDQLDRYPDKEESGADFVIEVPKYEFPEKEKLKEPEKEKNEFVIKGETELTLLPDAILSMRFISRDQNSL
ncbi:TPA: hypothetical protein DIU27_01135 [Candidatus Collierbacteria bacterium]|uniref:Uncharacterized protein n=1 Tax=Candidatus Collierbacteria bacterium GW2011_GWB2_44_22 TaxID=1618387 RepID=A0A0G1HX32_9BACT|nr:MAG: hypothetical protein UW31_C0010G0058 [Candidatus Collierbacteria bacterium GW2011_GWA2_44_13]KKT50813.1 MAG: hypothetical protein UW42_C0014G0008 [Candidatus Collierbacteria bacterium GW2011_GWB1_44_197]KKT51656.1 MAG: hypothetical protein UW44_C0009G0020 [Candidatus Collierbacteria bacterium GW2011_GWB2_44_22]KKT62584.1 MAG: hypothetical protein UW56_C0005G0020 [Candidatus Collierbacteria bacterium GW2011_GWD1_44_27]KKT66040.1 MAG: hypothetical protein UW58_C0014G0027 [Candidatus Colli